MERVGNPEKRALQLSSRDVINACTSDSASFGLMKERSLAIRQS